MSGESKKPVIRSIEDGFGERCLDILKHPDGTYTLKAFRRDPEDGGRWTLDARLRFFTQDLHKRKGCLELRHAAPSVATRTPSR